MLVDSGAIINLMSYFVFKKLGREGDEFLKTNLTLNGVGATRWRAEVSSPWSSAWGASCSLPHYSSSRCKVITVLFWVTIRFMPIVVFLLLCFNF
jgi:hypothetical protein